MQTTPLNKLVLFVLLNSGYRVKEFTCPILQYAITCPNLVINALEECDGCFQS